MKQGINNHNKETMEVRLSEFQKKFYYMQRHCKGTKKDGTPCKNIAIVCSDYCRFHSKIPSLKHLKEKLEQCPERYNIPSTFLRYLYRKNLQDKNILNLHDELAYLQSVMQELINQTADQNITPEKLAIQLQVIEYLRRLTETIKRIELQDKYFEKAQQTVAIVLQKIVVIIDKFITDKSTKQLIAQELYKIGVELQVEKESEIKKLTKDLKDIQVVETEQVEVK